LRARGKKERENSLFQWIKTFNAMVELVSLTCPQCGGSVQRPSLTCISCGEELMLAKNKNEIVDLWPSFEPDYDANEFSWTKLRGGLGQVLLLSCGTEDGGCNGPMDFNHRTCENCVKKRVNLAKEYCLRKMGENLSWDSIFLCRIK